jgi:SAM-dependent methyltransferase
MPGVMRASPGLPPSGNAPGWIVWCFRSARAPAFWTLAAGAECRSRRIWLTGASTLVGLDASARLLALAREAVPGTRFVLGDMRTADPGGAYDAVVAWDSVFHLPREDHQVVFGRFHSWLRAGGRLLLSLGGAAEAELRSEMFGERFTYSAHAPPVAIRLLEGAGFQVDQWEIDDPSSHGHVAVLATRRTG